MTFHLSEEEWKETSAGCLEEAAQQLTEQDTDRPRTLWWPHSPVIGVSPEHWDHSREAWTATELDTDRHGGSWGATGSHLPLWENEGEKEVSPN